MVGQKRIIDLRNHDNQHGRRLAREIASRPVGPREQNVQSSRVPLSAPDRRRDEQGAALLSWSAYEYEARVRYPYWWLWPGGGALALTILGILIHSYFFVAFVALAFVVVIMYGRRPPREIDFAVTREGVFAGRALHRFADIKSFCIFDAVEPSELSLEVDRITAPYLRLPLGEMHPNRIRAVLTDYIPEEQHKEFMSDHFARSLGF